MQIWGGGHIQSIIVTMMMMIIEMVTICMAQGGLNDLFRKVLKMLSTILGTNKTSVNASYDDCCYCSKILILKLTKQFYVYL